MKPVFSLLTALALTSQALAPCQQALAATVVNQQVAVATAKMNKAGTIKGAITEMKKHPAHSSLINEYERVLQQKKIDTNAHLPTYITKGNQLTIMGYGQPITVLGFAPFSLKIGADTWTATKTQDLAQVFDGLQTFLRHHSSKGMGQIFDLVVPSAQAGEIEIFVGGLITLWVLGTIMGGGPDHSSNEAAAEGRRIQKERWRQEDEARDKKMLTEHRNFYEEVLCGGVKFSPKARELMTKHGAPQLVDVVNTTNYRWYRESTDGHQHVPGEDLIALVWDFGDGHQETVEFSYRPETTVTAMGKQMVESHTGQGAVPISAKLRDGKPVFFFPHGKGDKEERYRSGVYADRWKNGAALGNPYAQDLTPQMFEESMVKWKMEDAANAPLPQDKISFDQFVAANHVDLMKSVCNETRAGEKLLSHNGVVPKYKTPEKSDTPSEEQLKEAPAN